MTTAQKRNAVKNAYPHSDWGKRVDKMTDDQVIAIYLRLKLQGKI